MAIRQLLIFFGAIAGMLGWVFLVGLLISGGNWRAAYAYFRAWSRAVLILVVAGLAIALFMVGISPG